MRTANYPAAVSYLMYIDPVAGLVEIAEKDESPIAEASSLRWPGCRPVLNECRHLNVDAPLHAFYVGYRRKNE